MAAFGKMLNNKSEGNKPNLSKSVQIRELFMDSTLKALRSRQKEQEEERKVILSLPKPWSSNLESIKLLAEKRGIREDEDHVEFVHSERDMRIKSVVSGFLVIHVLELLKIFITSKSFIEGVPLSLYLIVKCGLNLRTSTIYSTSNLGRIRIDAEFHLPIEISEWRDYPQNNIRLEIWGFQDPEAHYFIGTAKEHIFTLVKEIHGIVRKEVATEDTVTGEIVFEYGFSYGCLGYGHSNQLKNPDCTVHDSVVHSMFPRVALSDEDIVTNKFNIRTPNRLHLMTQSSFVQDMPTEGIVTKQGRRLEPMDLREPKKIIIQKVDYENGVPIHCRFHLKIHQTPIQADFNDTYGDYVCLTHRKHRLTFLEEMACGRKIDFREMEVGAIFEYMDEETVRKVIQAERHNDNFIYPDTHPCPESYQAKLDKEDEKFMDIFPSAARVSGYLGELFGFKHGSSDKKEDNDMNYPAYLQAGKNRGRRSLGCTVCCLNMRDLCRHMCQCFASLFNFLFPDPIINTPEFPYPIPEVSVTMPSPTGSAVNVYSYFVQEQKEPRKVNLTVKELARQAEILAEIRSGGAPNYGDIPGLGIDPIPINAASVKQSMAEAHVLA